LGAILSFFAGPKLVSSDLLADSLWLSNSDFRSFGARSFDYQNFDSLQFLCDFFAQTLPIAERFGLAEPFFSQNFLDLLISHDFRLLSQFDWL